MGWIYSQARDFDYWSYDFAQWMQLNRPSEGIPVEHEGLPVLIRSRGTVCSGFADELFEAERNAGWLEGCPRA